MNPSRCWLPFLGLALLAGCGENEDIRTEKVPKPPPTDTRILVALVQFPDLMWVFKAQGAPDAVGEKVKEFDAFIASLAWTDKQGQPAWELPEGWADTKFKGPREMPRVTTLSTGEGRAPALAVSVLPPPGPNATLLDNVNRWRAQVGLPDIDEKRLKQEGRAVKLAGGLEALVYDMEGPGPRPMTVRKPATAVTYKVPEGWKEKGPRKGMFSRIDMAFSLSGGGPKDEVTISSMGGAGGDRMDNINRWRGEVGLPELKPEQEPRPVPVTVGGLKGEYFDFDNPESRRTLLAHLRGDGKSWYVKLMAPSALAAKNKAAFDEFLKSVAFPGAK